ncbi:class I SAM-dependent rRNA methyltransferase [Candidatus Parcubacteria bacterium]|nr:MAG: class I SAM-dependent rRNA methyltransferase [Candidatus Parcubacteria bacterium]
MLILKTPGWQEYQLLDSGNGLRLELFGSYTLVRPDPQAIWKPRLNELEWEKADAVFKKNQGDKGQWVFKNKLPDKWQMHYKDLSFWIRLTPFKHTGVFPEQSVQWDWIKGKIASLGREVNLLNLFAYTGIASLAAASVGAKVTHLDASRQAIGWARDNQKASNLVDKPIRWILDDALKFTEREIKRNIRYDAIIMDPPIYGHGPAGERWDFNRDFPKLIKNCRSLLSNNPLFILVNAYAISSSATMLGNVIEDYTKDIGGKIEVGELALQEKGSDRLLSTGIFGRWIK